MEGLRRESTDGALRTTAVSPGFVRTELADSIDNPEVREQIRRSRDEFAIFPDAVARAIAFAGTANEDRVSCWRLKPTGSPSCSTITDTGNWPRRWSPASTCLRPHDKRC